MSHRVVLIGATGFFGRRLAHRLAMLDGIELIFTSRDAERASEVATVITSPKAKISALAFDRHKAADRQKLAALAPWLIIDASGPFQSESYDVARMALDIGAHWIDLADARDYLLGFEAALGATARSRGLIARAGASSTPALSCAVVEDLTRDWQRLDTVDIAIMPGGAGQVGTAVIRAILSYAGQPISTFNEGVSAKLVGWGSIKRTRIEGLGVRHLSPVETADAALLPARFSVTSRVTFSAGLESRIEHFGLLALARLKALGIGANLEALAPLLEAGRKLTRIFASDRGGMTVDCAGLDADGRQTWARWCLIAARGEGPTVPVLPAFALTQALLKGSMEPGAAPAIGVLPLAAIEALMPAPAFAISREIVRGGSSSLFDLACGERGYADLPAAVKAFHDSDGAAVWRGAADVDASTSLAGRFVRKLFGFPPYGRNVPVTITVDRRSTAETWTRNFAGRRFFSQLNYEGGNIVSERFGPFKILLGIRATDGVIEMPVVGWQLGRIMLPVGLAPSSDTREFVGDGGRFQFDVRISLPLVGTLAHYRGWLEPKLAIVEEKRNCVQSL